MVSSRSKVASRVTTPFTKISHVMATIEISSSMNPLVTRLERPPTVHLCRESWLSGGSRSVNRTLEAKARALAGIKGYVTNLQACPDGTPVTPDFVIGAYHRLFEIEKSFRMSKHDLQARPIYHHKRESIEAHLSVVFAALAVGRHIEAATGWSIKKFVRTARRYRTIQINAGGHTITAADPLPDDLHQAVRALHAAGGAH
jgi:hypothetical protein